MKKPILLAAAASFLVLAQPAWSQDSGAAAQIEAMPVESAQQFADMAASSNMLEIESSRLALDKGQKEEVKTFAQHMIDDHTKATEAMMAAAQADGVTPAAAMDPKHQAMLDQLNQAGEGEFDQAYAQLQLQAHQEAIALHKGFSDGDKNLNQFAAATLPTLVEHLEEAQKLQQ
jgi:putative membrane protein